MKYIQPLLFLSFLFCSSGCGSAEPIKRYSYPTSKYKLEEAVLMVINSNPHITVDTTQNEVIVRRNPDNPDDTATMLIDLSEMHGKDSADVAASFNGVIKIKIKVGEVENDYIFRFSGNEQDWKSSSSSAIFIQNVTDKKGNSICQGQNENGEFNSHIAKEFTSLFERELVSKVDEALKLEHSVD
jgi:hypothetical protein